MTNLLKAMVMTYSHAKVQGQRTLGSEDRVETNGRTDRPTDERTDRGDRITSLADAVGNERPSCDGRRWTDDVGCSSCITSPHSAHSRWDLEFWPIRVDEAAPRNGILIRLVVYA